MLVTAFHKLLAAFNNNIGTTDMKKIYLTFDTIHIW